MDTFQMNQDLVSEKSRQDRLREDKIVLPDYQRDYFRKYATNLPKDALGKSFKQKQRNNLLVPSGTELVLRFSLEEAQKSSFTNMMSSRFSQKVNSEVFRGETARVFEGFGIAQEDTYNFLSLAKIVRRLEFMFDTPCHELLKHVEVFYKLSSRGKLNKNALCQCSVDLLKEMDSIIPYLSKNERGISNQLLNELIDIILSIKRSVKSVYSQIEKPDKRYAALKKTIDSLGEEELQDSRLLLLRYQEVIEDIDTLLDEKNDQGKSILSTEQREVLTDSRAKLRLDFSKTFEQTVVTDAWATKDTEMRQFKGGFLFVCQDAKSEQRGYLRRERLKKLVTDLVNKWTPHDDANVAGWDAKDEILRGLKTKILSNEESISILLSYLFPKILVGNARIRPYDQQLELEDMKGYENSDLMPAFLKGLDALMGDVTYWAFKENAKSLSFFELLHSDMHERGLGVCKVGFSTSEGDKQFVIKPDERRFENAIIGEGGLADTLNHFLKGRKSGLAIGKRKVEGELETLGMKFATDGKTHGTLIECVNALPLEKQSVGDEAAYKFPGVVDTALEELAQLYCSVLGIYDLHYENVLYKKMKSGLYAPILVDVDCGLDIRLLGNYAMTCNQDGFKNREKNQKIITMGKELFAKFFGNLFNTIFNPEHPIKCRTVPIFTTDHDDLRSHISRFSSEEVKSVMRAIDFGFRENELSSIESEIYDTCNGVAATFRDHWEKYSGSMNAQELLARYRKLGGEGKIFDSNQNQLKAAVKCAVDDYCAGTIPFYEMDPITGKLTTHGGTVTVGQFMPDLDDEKRIIMFKKLMLENVIVEDSEHIDIVDVDEQVPTETFEDLELKTTTPALELLDDKGQLIA